MRPLLSYIDVFLLATSSSNASILQDACKTFSAVRPDIGYDYCIMFFQANKDDATADKHGLTVIATNITKATAMNTIKLTTALRTMVKDRKTHDCLGDCTILYHDIVGRLDSTTKGTASGTSPGLQDAMLYVDPNSIK
jgi:pectinesterase inhibitor-like protein